MSAPELIDDDEEGGLADEVESPMQLEERARTRDASNLQKQITELQQRLDNCYEAPKTLLVNIPYDATGSIIRINGVKYYGLCQVSETTLIQIEAMLAAKVNIERERLMKRGNRVGVIELERADATSRIVKRREGSQIL